MGGVLAPRLTTVWVPGRRHDGTQIDTRCVAPAWGLSPTSKGHPLRRPEKEETKRRGRATKGRAADVSRSARGENSKDGCGKIQGGDTEGGEDLTAACAGCGSGAATRPGGGGSSCGVASAEAGCTSTTVAWAGEAPAELPGVSSAPCTVRSGAAPVLTAAAAGVAVGEASTATACTVAGVLCTQRMCEQAVQRSAEGLACARGAGRHAVPLILRDLGAYLA